MALDKRRQPFRPVVEQPCLLRRNHNTHIVWTQWTRVWKPSNRTPQGLNLPDASTASSPEHPKLYRSGHQGHVYAFLPVLDSMGQPPASPMRGSRDPCCLFVREQNTTQWAGCKSTVHLVAATAFQCYEEL